MNTMILIFAGCLMICEAGLITHDLGGGDLHKATSYQNIHMEHFHAVPTYAKKEFKHLLEHPISIGKSSSNVKIQHGDKHNLGYAIEDNHNDVNENGFGKDEHESSQLLLNEEYSPSSNYDVDSNNSQDVATEDHEESDQTLLHHSEEPQTQYRYNYIPLASHGDSEDHGAQADASHYQPVMYVLQYQNENYDKPVHEQSN